MHFTSELKSAKPIDHRAIARDRIFLALVDATGKFSAADFQLYEGLASDLDSFILVLRAAVARASSPPTPLHDKNSKPQGLR